MQKRADDPPRPAEGPRRRGATGTTILVVLGMLGVAALAAWVMLKPPASPAVAAESAEVNEPVAWVLVLQGAVERQSRRTAITLPAVAPLAEGDDLVLADAARVIVIEADGAMMEWTGPLVVPATQLGAAARALDWAPGGPLAEALLAPLELLVAQAAEATAARGELRVFAPVGATHAREPVVVWAASPSGGYDVELSDAAGRVLATVRDVRPPLAWADWSLPALVVDESYRLVVRARGENAARPVEAEFIVVAPEPPPPAALGEARGIVEAVRALRSQPARLGDAWLALETLAPAWADNELGTRLRLAVERGEAPPDDVEAAVDE